MYAGRKRRKPVQRGIEVKDQKEKQTASSEGTKSNPSKRHRDRLNSELDRLASLLPFPEEVTSSLDKLSILRLSVSYLRTKNFFSVALKTHACKGLKANGGNHDNSKTTGLVDGWMPEGELLLQALNGFVLVITAEGIIFYSSHTIQDYLGFHQTDVMHQSVFDLIHTEDQQEFRRNLHWALNPPVVPQQVESPPDGKPVPSSSLVTYNPDQLPPENSSFLERNFVCRFRCLLDNSSGFLALTLQGRLKFLHGQNCHLDDGCNVPPQLALFAIATPLQPPSILEIRTKNMIFRTKHKLDFTPMACDARGKIVLGYTEAELRVRGSGYQFIHAADMLYCAENHVRMIKTGESGLTVFRLLTKDNRWRWVQANARLVYKNGKPDYIIATQRPLVEEEGGEHLRKRSMHLPFTFATGEALLYQSSYPIHGLTDSLQTKGKTKSKKGKLDKNLSKDHGGLDPSSLLGALMRQDESVYVCQPAVEPKMSFHSSLFSERREGEGQSSGGYSGGPLGGGVGKSWSALPNGVTTTSTGPNGEPPSSFDPLLATLDSLSLEGDETCSNSELFSALENLGLNAEDLELLLLDERMIRVEMDPDYIPSLNDLLTNNEILSYIQDSLENKTEEDQGRDSHVSIPPTTTHPPGPILNSTLIPNSYNQATPIIHISTLHPQATNPPVPQPTLPPHRLPKQPPILQLSQQMQQHLNLVKPVLAKYPWPPTQTDVPTPSQPDTLQHTNSLSVVHNGHWLPQQQHMHAGLDDHCHSIHPLVNGKTSQLGPQGAGQLKHHQHQNIIHLQSQWQQQNQHLQVQLQSQCHFRQQKATSNSSVTLNGVHPDPDWQRYGYDDQLGLTANGANGACTVSYTNGRADTLSHATGGEVTRADYGMGASTTVDMVMNWGTVGGTGHYQGQGGVTATPSDHLEHHKQHYPQVPSTYFHRQYPTTQNSLDYILGLSQPHHTTPSLDAYGILNSPASQDATNCKMESGCILNDTNVAYTGSCLLPNVNGQTASDSLHPQLDALQTLPTLPDPQTTGFYL
ncbi:aryl hydrocarbon receptor 1 alpha [Salmo salar]|uniref:Aryl hydrocarbon receptor n=1 Tax=Salmo salar TaxID=8030 RepID=Q6SL85_SALSA|nr:aryl hydrocarbon receptor 1 alpha [Salmo salar]AAS00539.1 aryl hydrocarbon receptor 1 alpha [Salmo salar]|eukprot:NP_001117158.1 aryl hydrocarbon receptor 1 alpha [Salmo salar]